MNARGSIRLPYAPLGEWLHTLGFDLDRDAARALGTDRTQIVRWRSRGWVGHISADAAAVALGTHPALIWPEWFDVEIERHST